MTEKVFNQIKEGLEEALVAAQGPEVDVVTDALLDRIEAGGLVVGFLSKKVLGYALYCEINKMPISQDAVDAFQELEVRFKGDKAVAEKLADYFIAIGAFFQEPTPVST